MCHKGKQPVNHEDVRCREKDHGYEFFPYFMRILSQVIIEFPFKVTYGRYICILTYKYRIYVRNNAAVKYSETLIKIKREQCAHLQLPDESTISRITC